MSSEEETKINKLEWNSKLEEVVKDIGQTCQGYKHMHIWQAQRANNKHKYLMIGGIGIGPTASVLQSIATVLDLESNALICIFIILLGFLSGMIVAIAKFAKYDEISNANKSAAARYTSIEANVRRQLGLYRKDRVSSGAYMDWLETKYEEILQSAPLLSQESFRIYSVHAEKVGLPIPDQYDHVIDITNESEHFQELKNTTKISINYSPSNSLSNSPSNSLSNSPSNSPSKLKRSSVMAKIPEINYASDKMLNYELSRLMGLR
tara:strand:+ start:2128 stop:2919 length:792 start_codon:yes stop_codon:yes gene_type:complete